MMDESQLKELYMASKGKEIKRRDGTVLGKIIGYFMGDEPKLTLDTEREVSVNDVLTGKLNMDGGANKSRNQITRMKDEEYDEENDDEIETEILKQGVASSIMQLGEGIKNNELGIPLLHPDPDFTNKNGVEAQTNNSANKRTTGRNTAILNKTSTLSRQIIDSPPIALLRKAKTKQANVTVELMINVYDESLIKILCSSYDGAYDEIIDHIVSNVDPEMIKQQLSSYLKGKYKIND